jgi:serine/threonine protein kinase
MADAHPFVHQPFFKAKHLSIIYHMIRRGKFSPLPSIYSKELQALLRRMMARDPAERPSCAEILQEEFLRCELDGAQACYQSALVTSCTAEL